MVELATPVVDEQLYWLEASAAYLARIQELLQQMAAISAEALQRRATPPQQAMLNREFQDLKGALSLIVDGNSGRVPPQAALNGVPLFLGYTPYGSGLHGINLYTRYQMGRSSRICVSFAEGVWGADNDRAPGEERIDFAPLTRAEQAYRRTHGIGVQNQIPQTAEELQARRMLNIFDPEFGGLSHPQRAACMYAQVRRAIGQIASVASRQARASQRLDRGNPTRGGVDRALESMRRGGQRSWLEAHENLTLHR